MIRQSTIELLKEMKFSAMAAELEQQFENEENYKRNEAETSGTQS